MKKEDFEHIASYHINACKQIINDNGICWDVRCIDCPFVKINSTINIRCSNYREYHSRIVEDKKLVENAKKFIELFGGEDDRNIN